MDTIRQMLLFSFEELYKMQTETRLELALRELQIPAGFGNLFKGSNERGPKGYSPKSMLYAIFAMRIEKIPNISALVRRLKSDMGFRYACGFDVLGKTPSASCFSRFLHKMFQFFYQFISGNLHTSGLQGNDETMQIWF